MESYRAFRMVRPLLGAALVTAWGAIALVTTSVLVAWVASPLLMFGLPLLAWGLPPRPGVGRLLVQATCYALAGAYALCSLVFVADLGAGTGAEYVFLGSLGTSTVAFLSGRRAGR